MNMQTICSSIGEILYSKGVMGHVTVDLVSFPDPTSPSAHPLFWAVDLNCNMTDYAASCYFFDFLMEGTLDQFTGRYTSNNGPDDQESRSRTSSRLGGMSDDVSPIKPSTTSFKQGVAYGRPKSTYSTSTGADEYTETRSFMYVKYLHHPGISKI